MPHDATSGISALLQAADRDVTDARTSAISLDRRFVTASLAVRHLAMAIGTAAGAPGPARDGCGAGGLEVLAAAVGSDAEARIRYLEHCRARCERIDRKMSSATELEVEELIGEVARVREEAQRWLDATPEERALVYAPSEPTGPSAATCPVAISMARVPQDTS